MAYSTAYVQQTPTPVSAPIPGQYAAVYVTPGQQPQYYYVQTPPQQMRQRKCVLRILCETLGWLASAVVCTVCSAACGAASCCINGFVEDEFVPGKPQRY